MAECSNKIEYISDISEVIDLIISNYFKLTNLRGFRAGKCKLWFSPNLKSHFLNTGQKNLWPFWLPLAPFSHSDDSHFISQSRLHPSGERVDVDNKRWFWSPDTSHNGIFLYIFIFLITRHLSYCGTAWQWGQRWPWKTKALLLLEIIIVYRIGLIFWWRRIALVFVPFIHLRTDCQSLRLIVT